MHETRKRKLQLSRERIRTLTSRQAGAVVGGYTEVYSDGCGESVAWWTCACTGGCESEVYTCGAEKACQIERSEWTCR